MGLKYVQSEVSEKKDHLSLFAGETNIVFLRGETNINEIIQVPGASDASKVSERLLERATAMTTSTASLSSCETNINE